MISGHSDAQPHFKVRLELETVLVLYLEPMIHKDFDPEYVFTHHRATPEKLKQYELIHESAKQFARVILENVPESSDRAAALRLLRESAMMACAAISLDGRWK
jgi:hypothetical protein